MATYAPRDIRRIAKNAEALFSVFRRIEPKEWLDRSARDMDAWIGRELSRLGVSPSMSGYRGYPANSCISPNETAVHGIPGDRTIRRGDIFTVDIAGQGGGWMADSAWSYHVPGASDRALRTIHAAWGVLRAVTSIVRAGVSVREIASCAQDAAVSVSGSVIPQFAGHGIGRSLHETPQIPFVANGETGPGGYRLGVGEVVSIEPVVTLGDPGVECDENGWDCRTVDASPTAHFEITVVVDDNGCDVLGLGNLRGRDLPDEPPFG